MRGLLGTSSLFAHVTFWVLLAYGWFSRELSDRSIAIFLALWAAGLCAVAFLGYPPLFTSILALLDIVLVLMLFQGDIRLP